MQARILRDRKKERNRDLHMIKHVKIIAQSYWMYSITKIFQVSIVLWTVFVLVTLPYHLAFQ